MYKLTGITSDALQDVTLSLPDNLGQVVITMYFVEQQYGWFITKLTYNDFVIQNFRIFNSLNMLHQYKNIIPFGLACMSTDNREPSLIADFSSQASILYILDTADVEEVDGIITGG